MKKEIVTTIFLLSHYGLLDGHVVEIHLPNAGEDYQIECGQREIRNEKNLEIIRDESASFEERQEAYQQLVKDEGIS